MKQSILLTLSVFLFFTSCGDIPFDTSERGGFMMATDEKTVIIEKLAKAYTEGNFDVAKDYFAEDGVCLLYTSPSPRDRQKSRMPSSA